MIAVPVAALVLFSAMDLQRRLQIRDEMIMLDNLTRVAMTATELASALQDERSLTAGSVTAENGGTAELEFAYGRTDELVDEFQNQLNDLDIGDQGEQFTTTLAASRELLGNLSQHRQEVASGELSTAAAVSVYNDLTSSLHPVVTLVAQRSTNVEVKTDLIALDMLVQLKESADLERAALNVAFTSDQISAGLLQAVVEMISRQETLQQLFLAHLPEEVNEQYQTNVLGDVLEEVEGFRLDALEGVGLESLGVNSRQWWRASTDRIDALSEVEQALAEITLTRVSSLRGGAARAAWFGALGVLLGVGGAVVLSAIVGRAVSRQLASASDTIREVVSQISSSVQQLSASTGETAAAVSQTSTTVDELRQTSEAAAHKAKATSEAADNSRGASDQARASSERGVTAMQSIRVEVEGIAQRIVELSEKNSQISDIVTNVNAIAEQSNLLAVNASIEAAKAGEQGRGFAVVASEVKTLAERSKEATEQIRTILTEVQRSSNAAVMVTEQGVKRTDEGNEVIEALGSGIRSLAVTIEESADAAQQISLISAHQLAGIEQITEALKSVEQAASDNASGAGQLEAAASQLESVSDRITMIVRGENAVDDGR
jgi:methyl-accepting chemotaxis protein